MVDTENDPKNIPSRMKEVKKYRQPDLNFLPQTIQAFKRYTWPGDIRKLQPSIERAVIMCEENELLPTDFYFAPQRGSQGSLDFDNLNLYDIERAVITRALTRVS